MFPDRLHAARLNARLSQRALARRSGLPQRTVWRLENGYNDPLLGTVRRLAAALGETCGWLLLGRG